ncbi:MAG: HEAT repeat domain-containing protein, partial [Candidatus Sulfotelmatobacter sp.]
IEGTGPAPPISHYDQQLQANAYSANLALRRTIKGMAPDQITLIYALPVQFVGFRGLHTGTRLLFLRRTDDGYSVAEPYYPDFPAVAALTGEARGQSSQSDYKTAVLRELWAVVGSAGASASEIAEILRVGDVLPHSEEARAALRKGLANTDDSELRQRIQGELVAFGDVNEVPEVVHLLLGNLATENHRTWLLYVIANQLSDRRAIPVLQPLLRSADSSLRRAAVEGLWHMADSAAVPDLAQALQDPDEQVRFYAVRGLSDIASQRGWGGPSESEFDEHQQKYLAHWLNWAKDKGQ